MAPVASPRSLPSPSEELRILRRVRHIRRRMEILFDRVLACSFPLDPVLLRELHGFLEEACAAAEDYRALLEAYLAEYAAAGVPKRARGPAGRRSR